MSIRQKVHYTNCPLRNVRRRSVRLPEWLAYSATNANARKVVSSTSGRGFELLTGQEIF